MSVQIIDLAHNRDGFESTMISDLTNLLRGYLELDVYEMSLSLDIANETPSPAVNSDTLVVVVVCHGELSKPRIEAAGGRIVHHVGEFALVTPVCGEHELDFLPDDVREGALASLRDPGLLTSLVRFPEHPFAIVWYVCNSDPPDAALFHVKQCRASLSFLGDAVPEHLGFVVDVIGIFHSVLARGGADFDSEPFDNVLHGNSIAANASFILRNGPRTILIPPHDEDAPAVVADIEFFEGDSE